MSARKKSKKSNKASFPFTHVESDFRDEALQQKEAATFTTPVSISVYSKRKRLVDADGVSAKAAIDGIVHSGILPDDSPQYVKEVSYSQDKDKAEETIITLWEDDADETN